MVEPPSWTDTIHEDEGGDDSVGERQQNGQAILRDELHGMLQRDGIIEAWDEVSHKPLDPTMVKAARKAEMEYFDTMGVYTRAPRSHQLETGGEVH